MAVPYFILSNGKKMPAIGLGTWRSPPEIIKQVVKDAIDIGYRHFDCAHSYGNEDAIGEAIKEKIEEKVVTRQDLYIVSKLWTTFMRPDLVRPACETSLKKLNIDYFDNYLIHWPTAFKEGEPGLYPKDENDKIQYSTVDYVDTWRAMEDLVDCKLCHSIGISNFNPNQIERVLAAARIRPVNLQIECHPYLNQKCLLEYCTQKYIIVTAYSPLGSGHSPYAKPGDYPILQHPKIIAMAGRYAASPAQILLRYQVQRGVVVIPRSINKAHLESNLKICTIKLSDADMNELNSLDFGGRIQIWSQGDGHPHHPFQS